MRKNVFWIAASFALIAVLCWSGNFVIGRAIRAEISPASLSFWRWAVASVILLPVALRTSRAEWAVIRNGWPALLALGLFGAALFQTMTYIGLTMTPATNALLLTAFNPMAVILLAWLVLGERAGLRQWIGVIVSFVGVLVLVTQGDLEVLKTLSFNRGDLWIFGAVLIWGCYSVSLKLKPVGVRPMMVVFCTAVSGAIMVLPFYILDISDGQVFSINYKTVSGILYTGVFASVIAFASFNAAVARIGPSKSSYFLHLMPVFGAILAYFILGERLEAYHFVGFPIALAGVIVATTG
jgi:drug/metabolite transporter (DMT)-like permease